ncbi:MAG: hypothetical protein M3Q22_10830 [Actinomycetota bacterium]|nr:hypothetical protein [Actinomycetota bacterium]
MSAKEGAGPLPTGTGPQKIAAAKQVASAVQCRAERARSAPLTLAALSAALRDYNLAKVDEATDPWWRSCADRAIDYLAALDQPFTVDAVAALVPEPERPCQWGARFHAAVRSGVIRPVGYVLSERPSRHRGVVRLYRGGDAR